MKNRKLSCIITALFCALLAAELYANGQTAAFTYQGRLMFDGAPADGLYDFEFLLYETGSGGTPIGDSQSLSGVSVADGIFTVELDFGALIFDGNARWLEIGVTTNGGGAFTTLSPRQRVTATPYAIKAINAGSASTAGTAGTAGTASTLLGYVPGDFAEDTHSHAGGDINAGIVGAAYIDTLIARDSELTWGNLAGIPADIADGDQIGIISESDPQVGSNSANYVPKWNGSALVSGIIYDSGNKIGIGTGGTALDTLEVAGTLSMNVSTNDMLGLSFRKSDAKYWSVFTAPWLNGDDLWIRRESDAGLGYGNIDVMVFDRATGNVGIHTTTPQATLHVNGDLKVNGSITYDSAETGYASVSAAAFHPSASTTTYNNDGTWIYPSVNNASFYAGVSLPHGATVTSVEWTAATGGEGDYARLRLVRRNLAGTSTVMAECYSQSGATAVLTDSTISSSTVDNSQYVYYLDMFLTAPSILARGGAAIITYTYPGP